VLSGGRLFLTFSSNEMCCVCVSVCVLVCVFACVCMCTCMSVCVCACCMPALLSVQHILCNVFTPLLFNKLI
jgi:hypothetical protein